MSTLTDSLNTVFRKAILTGTSNRAVSGFVDRYGMQLGAARFVAGETLDDAVQTLRRLEDQGLATNTTLLGEGVDDATMANAVADEYIEILDRLKAEGLETYISLKLTHLGLDLGEDVAYGNVARVVAHASEIGAFIRIDMEESDRVDPTLRIYKKLREAGHEGVGTVLQSALYRTPADLRELMEYRPNLRIVKGAYLEPPEVAYRDKRDVDSAYLRLAKYSLAHGSYTAIATHDRRIIDFVIEYTARNNIPTDRFEFQMLYGIASELQLDLVSLGYRVLVATPFGPEWYLYLMRRLAERPANLLFLGKNLLPG